MERLALFLAFLTCVRCATISVSSASELLDALDSVSAGDTIELEDGKYQGSFVANNDGSSGNPITLTGGSGAVLSNDNGYGFHLQANYWILDGFTVSDSTKGIVLDQANHNVLQNLHVTNINEEGVHFRTYSSNNVIQDSRVDNTGLTRPGYGEGIYIGSAVSNWDTYTDGNPDTCDNNKVLNNHVGPNCAGECIDIKEGTTGGLIQGNTLDGSGESNVNYDDSWIDVKGNDYQILENSGKNTLNHGFEVHVQVDGWGCGNEFHDNELVVNAPGYGIYVVSAARDCTTIGSDNTATGADSGLTNGDVS